MKIIRNLFDRIEPHVTKGGKFARLYPLYEMADTFLFTPSEVTQGASHVRDGLDLKRMMITVGFALFPCGLITLYNTGYQANQALADLGLAGTTGWRGMVIETIGIGYDPSNILANIIHGALYFFPIFLVCNAVGGLWEALFALIRKHEISEGFLVTGLLFPLILPPTIPLMASRHRD